MSKKAPDERPKKPLSLNPNGTGKKVSFVEGDRGTDLNSNLKSHPDEDKGSHVIRTKKHPFHDVIEKNGGMQHRVDSHLFKAYNDTIKNRIANYKPGDNINRPIHGAAGVFQRNSELESHFRGPDMDKKHANPDYNKTVYYGSKKHTDESPGYFSGVYKTEEHIPKTEIEVKPQTKVNKTSNIGTIKRNTEVSLGSGAGLFH